MAHELPTSSPPTPPPLSRPKRTTLSTHPAHKTLASAANLANLLPTGTVLAFRTLAPSFSNKGVCQLSNKCLTGFLIAFCAVVCFISSFTDSFTDDGKLYYGVATFKGLHVFNGCDCDQRNNEPDGESLVEYGSVDLSRFRIKVVDYVHAFVSLFVFLAFAFSDSEVQNCFFDGFNGGHGGGDLDVLVMNLPVAAGIFASFFFMIFPTTRRGIGYADMPAAKFR